MATRQGSQQNNAMLYALITFVALFIIATVCAVIFYIKSEEFRTQYENGKSDWQKIASIGEQGKLSKIVGKPEKGKSYLGTIQKLVDDLYSIFLGQEAGKDIPATVKFNEISMKTGEIIVALGDDASPAIGPSGVALLQTITDLKQKLDAARAEIENLNGIQTTLQDDLDDMDAQAAADRAQQLAEVDRFQKEADQISAQFDQLKATLEEGFEEQIDDFKNKLEAEQAKLRQKQLDLQENEKKLEETNVLLDGALTKLDVLKPDADNEVQAFDPDAQIVRVDLKNGIIYLDAGIQDRIYRGLTFAIYDRNKPIPEDGKGKAEIEVFQVAERVSAARLVRSDINDPVVKEDIVTNLIWDSETTNRFVVAGNFDFNNDGRIDADGDQRIVELIERWGGTIMEDITVNTDFIVVGVEPAALPRPTQNEIDIDPMAQIRYQRSVDAANSYNAMLKKAQQLGVPVFNQKRFMYLIGYDTVSAMNPTL
ncbi:MAG: hypothetical protein ACYTET_06110 [Planctomycetota bacterium]|jgi:hypothetical protein